MAKLSTDELLDAFKEMTLIELSEFVKQFEETFNVTAAAPVAVAARATPISRCPAASARVEARVRGQRLPLAAAQPQSQRGDRNERGAPAAVRRRRRRHAGSGVFSAHVRK